MSYVWGGKLCDATDCLAGNAGGLVVTFAVRAVAIGYRMG
jgi:hypothetical protein